jgi:small subunit ribosomal protein S6
MPNYESTFICSPELPTEGLQEILDKVKKIVEASGSQITALQQLGMRKLAYPIKKCKEGNYIYMEIAGLGTTVAELENFYKVHDSIIRYLTVQAKVKKIVRPAAEQPKAASEEVKENEPDKSTSSGTK